MQDASPLWQQVLFFLLAPPIGALVFRAMIRGWAHIVQGSKVSDTTEKRQGVEFRVILVFMYVMLFCIFVYGYIQHHR